MAVRSFFIAFFFQLAYALSRHAIAIRQFLQRRLIVFVQPAGADNVLATLVQTLHRVGQLVGRLLFPVIIFNAIGKVRRFILQVEHRCHRLAIGLVVRRHVEGHVLRRHTGFHFTYVFARHAQLTGHHLDFILVKPAQTLLSFTQVKEQLTLRFGGRDFHNTPVTQNVFVNFSLNPVYGEGNQTHAHFRVETTHGFHQANVAFLNQIRLRQAIARVITSNMNNKAQVRQDQPFRCFQIALVMQLFSKLPLFISR